MGNLPTNGSGAQADRPDSERLLTAAEVARLLKVPTSWVYRASREGNLPGLRFGRYVRFDRCDLDRWLASQKGGSDGE